MSQTSPAHGTQVTHDGVVATYDQQNRAWNVDLPEYGPGKPVTFIPYWVTHRLAHTLGTDFNVVETGQGLRITGRLLTGYDAQEGRVVRALSQLGETDHQVTVHGAPTEGA